MHYTNTRLLYFTFLAYKLVTNFGKIFAAGTGSADMWIGLYIYTSLFHQRNGSSKNTYNIINKQKKTQ